MNTAEFKKLNGEDQIKYLSGKYNIHTDNVCCILDLIHGYSPDLLEQFEQIAKNPTPGQDHATNKRINNIRSNRYLWEGK
jgi:hypothetical protein